MVRQLDIIDDTALRGDARLARRPPVAKYSVSSSVKSCVSRPRKYSVSSSVKQIERMRVSQHLSHGELCRRAVVSERHWFRILAGEMKPQPATLQRLNAALRAVEPRRTPEVVRALQRLVMDVVAAHFGLQADDVATADFTRQRPEDARWLAAARCRMIAVYVLTVELQVPNVEVARALGMTRANVSYCRNKVEGLRDDPAIDAAIAAVTGRVVVR